MDSCYLVIRVLASTDQGCARTARRRPFNGLEMMQSQSHRAHRVFLRDVYGCGHSLNDGIMRSIDVMICGKHTSVKLSSRLMSLTFITTHFFHLSYIGTQVG